MEAAPGLQRGHHEAGGAMSTTATTSAMEAALPEAAAPAYAGPERRWMTRSLYDWTWRSEQHNNKYARNEARSIAILEALRAKALKRHRTSTSARASEEADALWDGIYEIQQKLNARRERIARACAPWFEGEAP